MDPLTDQDPVQVGKFQLLGRLGAGGMGHVFLGRSQGGRPIAVKVIHREYANDPGFRTRFAREVAAAQRVSGLYTAQVIDADTDADLPWMATKFIEGPNLQDHVQENGPMPAAQVVDLAAGIAEALEAIHDAQVIHRDLKPSNVIISAEGPQVIDFGIARAFQESIVTLTGQVLGTPAYMSPEQITGDSLTEATDIFSLGGLLYFAVTGERPFTARNHIALTYQIAQQAKDLSAVADPFLRDLVGHCLAKNPSARPSAATVLARCSGPLPSPSPQAPSPADRETVARRPVPSGDDLSTFDRSTLLRESGDPSPPVRGGGRFGEPGRSDTAPVPAAAATVRDLRDRARTVPSAPQPPVGSGRGRGRVRLPRRAGRFLTVAVLLAVTAWPGNAMLQDTLWMRRRHAAAEGERLLPGSTCEGIGYDDKKWKYFPECLIQVHRSSGRSLWVNATIFPDPRHNTSETFDTSRYGSDWAKVKTDLLSGCTRSSGDVFLDGSAGNVDRYYALRTQGTTDVLCYEVVMKPNGTPKVWVEAQLWIRDRKRDAWAKVGYGIKQSAGFESGPQIQQLTMDGGKPLTVAEWDQLWEVSDTVFKHLPAT